ncbi:MAG: RNA polymerase sigma factor, partial [Gemmatimonadales bacterium]
VPGSEGPRGRPRHESSNPQPRRGLFAEREASLRQRLVARDEQALVELIELTTPWLLSVAQAMLQDRDEAEEVVMDTFRIAWESVTPATGGPTGLMPYLLRVARHRAIDRLRGRRRKERKLLAAAREWDRRGVAPVEPNEAGHPGWQVHAQVHAALEALPAEQRAAVQLAYFEGLTQSEVATRLGIPLGTVKTRLRLAFDRLRTALAGLKDWVL